MEWVISNKSALEFWRKAFAEDALSGEMLYAYKLPKSPIDASSLDSENALRLARPLHVLVGSSNARKATSNLTCHIDSRNFPVGSFIRLPSGIVVISPELCFAQMASELSLVELIVLGFEFCGGYRMDAAQDPDRGFRDDLPLTSVAKLSTFVASLSGMKGHKNACKALRYIIDGSASPMETTLVMLLTLPYRLGGYGFPKPLMNAAVNVQVGPKNSTRLSRYYCDLYWADEQVDVEYDSDAYHAKTDQIFKDAARRNALSSVGVTVITVSRRQVVSAVELRKTADVLSRLLEKRLKCQAPEFAERHAALRSTVLPKVHTRETKV